MLSRRQALTLAAAGLAGAAMTPRPAAAGLTSAFAPKRIPYGACVSFEPLQGEIDYRDALQTYCQQLTPEAGLFWGWLRPTAAQFRFDYADAVLAFAEANNMTMVGHTLVWYGAMPDWTKNIEGAADAERTMTEHIEKVVGRYRGKIKTWHVVNEPIDEANGDTPGLRPNVWLSNLGDRYMDLAFKIAHRVGLQGHVRGQYEIDRDGLYDFVAELHSLGLAVHVTELDVIDKELPGPIAVRDAIVGARAHDFLDAVFAAAPPESIATWGITDRYTWVPTWNKRSDSLPNRPLPLDANYQKKPLWDVIDYFCKK